MIPNWNKILKEWSYRVGVIKLNNSEHLYHLNNILEERGWPHEVINGVINNLTEADKVYKANWPSGQAPKGAKVITGPRGGEYYMGNPETGEPAQTDGQEKGTKKKKETSKTERTPLEKELSNLHDETSKMRDKGVAGAGGEAASQGESRYCKAVDNLDFEKFNEENKEELEKELSGLDSRKPKYPSTKEVRELASMGLTPESDEGKLYIVSREVWAKQELKRMQEMEKPNVFSSGTGFGGKEGPYMEWMRAAYDGALATQKLLEESRIDTSQPHQTIQSTTEIDDKVQSGLEKKLKEAKTPEDKKHYEKELKSFKKFRTYHDTYVIGRDKNGRTFIVSVSNKKDSGMSDPQANTTPAARFEVMKKDFGTKTAKIVTDAIDDGIKKVTTVAQQTIKTSSEMEVDDDFVNVAEVAAPKRVKQIAERGLKRDRSTSSGKVKKGHELGVWLKDNNISEDDWNGMSKKEQIQYTQKFMGDESWHNENGTSIAYDPFGKLFIKVGEVDTGGHRSLNKVRAELEKRGQSSSLESDSIKSSGNVKRAEQTSVKEAHQSVVNKVTEADKEQGFPKDGKNGSHTQAYISTVMSAMHYDTYIDMDDDEDDKLILQMGIKGAKASHIRDCLAEKSGYDLKNGDREGLKQHLKETCTIEAETGAIVINSKDEDGEKTHIADDTWRTAGTSQKVASGFGKDMKDCVGGKVDKDRDGI
jgi:hypothetical protein